MSLMSKHEPKGVDAEDKIRAVPTGVIELLFPFGTIPV